ncbi:hypothetical protein GJ496_011792 [Pomphorhynchus laevis]|nr:hypothetical protein GJ496_011792 [Pomphorhynchus laevis]
MELARRGYFNGCSFFRIIRDFIIQSGDPTDTGRSRISIYGSVFKDELHPDLKFTGAGILASANTGPNTNCAQFFITLAPTPWLDGQNTIFGRVSSGMEVVRNIGFVEVREDERPVDPVHIKSAEVVL